MFGGLSDGGGGGTPTQEGMADGSDMYFTPFRPARLSTVLLLDCKGTTSSSAEGEGPLSARQILELLCVIAPRIAFLHIVREDRRESDDGGGGGGGVCGGGIVTHVLITLDSIEAAEGWMGMMEGRGE